MPAILEAAAAAGAKRAGYVLMRLPFAVKDVTEMRGLLPGAIVEFTLVVGKSASYAEGIRVRRYESVEQDPLAARRLSLLTQVARGVLVTPIQAGETVPDFRLIDQHGQPVSLSQMRGKTVAVNFMYTTCVLPDFCLRIVNHFAVLQKRFKTQLGRDLMFVFLVLSLFATLAMVTIFAMKISTTVPV